MGDAGEGRGTYRYFEASMGAAAPGTPPSRTRPAQRGYPRENAARLPQKCLNTGRVVGLEALLRWTHPTRGDIPPAECIPLAEESGSILQIGEWVLRTACSEAATWREPLAVAVNVSAVQIHSANFASTVH